MPEETQQIDDVKIEEPQKVPKLGVRHVMTVLLHTFLICMIFTRSTLSLTIVAMTDSTASSNPNIPTYEWNNTGIVLSSFFWSYVVLQPFSGYIFILLGLKWVVLGSMLVNILAFMLIPTAIYSYGTTGLIICRLVQGLAQGFFYPAVHHALGLWVPEDERSLLAMIARAGNKTGYIIAMLTTGFISASWWGWPSVFYILGVVCLIWCLFWILLASDSPANHFRISEAEKNYIEHSLETREKEDVSSVPFKAILTSLPFWAIAVANAGISWGYTLTDTYLPTYLSSALDFDITSNGAISASPQIVELLILIPLAPLGDYWVSRKQISLWTWRRLTQGFGSFIPALALIWLAYISKEQRALAVVLLNVYIGVNAILIFGSLVNHVDLSPRYAGVMLSIENTIAQAIAMFAPIFTQYVVTDLTDIVLWRSIFLSLAAILALSGAFFIVFGKAEIQWWNSKDRRESKKITQLT